MRKYPEVDNKKITLGSFLNKEDAIHSRKEAEKNMDSILIMAGGITVFDFVACFRELQLPYWTAGKNVRPGAVNICCPFCGDHSNHCSGIPATGQVLCWRCGSHTLQALLKAVGKQEPRYYLQKYGTRTAKHHRQAPEEKQVAGHCKLPAVEKELNPRAAAYLEARGFDPVWLQYVYDIRSTGPVGRYKFRIVIPVYYRGELVSFVCRDYTGRQEIRYMTATRDEEQVCHKDILYNLDSSPDFPTAVLVVEGITDVWRIGQGCVATFGTTVTPAQVRLLAGLRKPVYILFDAEPEAQQKALQLQNQLLLLGAEAYILELPAGVADPGELSTEQVEKIRTLVWGK